ncbi:gluconokinase [Nocardia sp. NPDC052254]|uniref:gluconokinase n=1 Tax=Nocardia sp. NPDC052254 TaxID=3155681 RepID=UPI00343D709A
MSAGEVPGTRPGVVVVMGVSGSGKTVTARLLADRLGVAYADADDMHPPANIAKMSAGVPLDDGDREPWLATVGTWLRDHDTEGGVIACSALARRYRDRLRTAAPELFFLLLTADRAVLLDRLARREHHFMPAALLDSQLGTLEPLAPEERGAIVRTDRPPDAVVERAAQFLGR